MATIVNGTHNSLVVFNEITGRSVNYVSRFSHSEGKRYVIIGLRSTTATGAWSVLRVYGGKWGNKFKVDEHMSSTQYMDDIQKSEMDRLSHGYTKDILDDNELEKRVGMILNKFDMFYTIADNHDNTVFEQISNEAAETINSVLGELRITADQCRLMNEEVRKLSR